MKDNKEKNDKDITLKSIAAGLRSLPELEVPGKLKQKLFATIPNRLTVITKNRRLRGLSVIWRIGTAAAAIIILASILLSNLGRSTSSNKFTVEMNEVSKHYVLADQNNRFIIDSNYVDCNGQ
ncbi:hypothetical protein ACFL1G_06885 [Planctomycetota bacterium]